MTNPSDETAVMCPACTGTGVNFEYITCSVCKGEKTVTPPPSPFAHPNPGGARSPERIWSVLADVGEYWRANPDMRLTQVVLNATKHLGVSGDKAYNVEDAPLVAALRQMLAEQPPTPVTCHRLVPLSHAAMAALTLPGAGEDGFVAWFDRLRPGIGRLSDCRVLTTDLVEDLLASPDLPTDDAGIEWATDARMALALTLADDWRPYDSVVIGATHRVHAHLAALSEEVTRTSPLLTLVAESIDMLLHARGNTIGSYRELLDESIGTGEEFLAAGTPWAHIEALLPGLRESLVAVIEDLLSEIPAPADDDHFLARTSNGEPQ